jgi:hypothetical protein
VEIAGAAAHLTLIEQLVWWEGVCLTPLELSLPLLNTTDAGLIASCKSLHGFMRDFLEDMRQNPQAYFLNAGEYEAFLHGRSEIEARRENKEKHNQARSKCYWLVGFHQQFLMEISRRGIARADGLLVTRADFEAVVRQVSKSPYLKGVDAKTRIAALSRTGLEMVQDAGAVFLTWRKAPDLFVAMARLSRGGEKDQTFGALNFKCCNFAQIERGYRPDFTVVTHGLSPVMARRAERINQFAARFKMSPVSYGVWKMSYAYQGLAALRFSALYGEYEVHVNFGLNPAEMVHFERILSAQPPEVREFSLRHLNFCRNCGYCQKDRNGEVGTAWTILGGRRRLCGVPALRIADPGDAEMEMIERVIELRLETIRAIKSH